MATTRRDFITSAATTAAALTLSPIAERGAEALEAAAPANPVLEHERRMLKAHPVPLERVRLTGGPLKRAQDVTIAYLLALDPDRMLAAYRTQAGLPTTAKPLTGWDGTGRNLTGHIAGHHLSAVSLMYKATGDARFKQRADYLVKGLAEVQAKNGDGYCGALEGLRDAFARVSKGDIKSGAFDLNGLWSPWYTLHKTFAGLRDAYRHTGNLQALTVEKGFAAWAEGVIKPLSDDQVQKMLLTEFGGMNEVFADLYADTNDPRWLNLSLRFEHHAFTEPLKRHQDNLSGKHGNCQIPKLIGSAARYGYTADPQDIMAASFFWDRVVRHHSYATGGHGLAEYFGPPDALAPRVDGRAAETCNVYNMLKLTRRLFAFRPDAAYADFHERALFNHILGSIEPDEGRTSYMVPVGRREQQEYQDMQRDFTCCVGSGMESHALHGLGVWYESRDTVWLNLFVPSTATTTMVPAQFALDTGFPDGDSATVTVTVTKPTAFTLAVRRPLWAGDGFRIAVNGENLPQPSVASLNDPVAGGRAGGVGNESEHGASTYVRLTRTWRSGDTVSMQIPKTVTLEPTPDDPSVAAFLWGPLVLAADHGPRRTGRENNEANENAAQEFGSLGAVMVSASRSPADLLAPVATGEFRTRGVMRVPGGSGSDADVTFRPFYRTHKRTYGIYQDVLTPQEFEARTVALARSKAAAEALERATISKVAFGDAAAEAALKYRSEPADRPVSRANRRTGRGGAGFFEYTMPSDATAALALVVTYFNDPGLPAPIGDFAIRVDGTQVVAPKPNPHASGFYDATYELPAELSRGKSVLTVRIEGARIVPIYGLRVVRR
ncbi:MAG: glycoside hydrolase family 127 protein [Gemmatimonadaceae bacterium]|nr:glycoside hydrolase family 127 protein [Gemmatimonadaceae bacterium]